MKVKAVTFVRRLAGGQERAAGEKYGIRKYMADMNENIMVKPNTLYKEHTLISKNYVIKLD